VTDPGHTHTQKSINDDYNGSGGSGYPDLTIPSFAPYDSNVPQKTWTDNINSGTTGITVSIGNTGTTETRPYNYGVVWLIKY
jgi:hypothetical protein